MTEIRIEPVTRIESHGKLNLEYNDDGSVDKAYFTTPVLRGFEAFLTGSPVERVPWLASRICGVCPVFHAVGSARAIEKALGIQIPDTADVLREILVLSQLIDSHALSFVVLSLPDLVPRTDFHSVVDIKTEFPELFEKGLRLHSLGRLMTSTLGGRNVHPVNVRVGGMAENPLLECKIDFASSIDEASSLAVEFLGHLKTWFEEQSDLVGNLGSVKSNYMALSNNGTVSFVKGDVKIANEMGEEINSFNPDQYLDILAEKVTSDTYMKAPYLKSLGSDAGTLRVNCLARANVNTTYGTSIADSEIQELRGKWGTPLEHSLLSHWTRLIETVYACERIKQLLDSPESKGTTTSVEIVLRDGEAVSSLEAPRGTLFHHYSIKNGHVDKANLLVATQNNLLAVNNALTQALEYSKANALEDARVVRNIEMVLRAYDPCISCSTHIVRPTPRDE
ncbi:MAG: Ni/Fe hydrogenase subunit alpha [Candidatus Thorarchaeota archaeon]|nr:Ni/Fe hydrogenase subunit alpha [Candidatus Thorarchaeota archaeon]